MKEQLKQLAAYNLWANQKLTDFILSIPPEKQTAEVPSSFKSIHATLLHMWDSESAWWQRMKMHERMIIPSENFREGTKEVVNGLLNSNRQWEEWVSNASELSLDHVFQYQNSKKEHFKQPTWQMLLHVFNHGSYHRGQLVNMLRQLGVDKIPQTDFIVFTRSRRS